MVLVMRRQSTDKDADTIVKRLQDSGLEAKKIQQGKLRLVGVSGPEVKVKELGILEDRAIERSCVIDTPYKLVSRRFKEEDTVVTVGDCQIGGGQLTVIGGPCSIESEDQLLTVAQEVKAAGGHILRGGAYKPRTSPYSFQGLGITGLKYLRAAGDATGLPVITEVMATEEFETVEKYADILQIGARNMQNFPLLRRAGKSRKPVLLKRGLSATVTELLMAAEYIMSEGNDQVILCERGIRTFEQSTRNTLDLSVIATIREKSHLPIIVDPSHATGTWKMVEPMSMAATAAGASGLMIEVHHAPEKALCDGPQSLKPEKFKRLVQKCLAIQEVIQDDTKGL